MMKFLAGQIAQCLYRMNDNMALAVGLIEPPQIEDTANQIFKLYCEILEMLKDIEYDFGQEHNSQELPLLPVKLDQLYLLSNEQLVTIKEEIENIEVLLARKLEQ